MPRLILYLSIQQVRMNLRTAKKKKWLNLLTRISTFRTMKMVDESENLGTSPRLLALNVVQMLSILSARTCSTWSNKLGQHQRNPKIRASLRSWRSETRRAPRSMLTNPCCREAGRAWRSSRFKLRCAPRRMKQTDQRCWPRRRVNQLLSIRWGLKMSFSKRMT